MLNFMSHLSPLTAQLGRAANVAHVWALESPLYIIKLLD